MSTERCAVHPWNPPCANGCFECQVRQHVPICTTAVRQRMQIEYLRTHPKFNRIDLSPAEFEAYNKRRLASPGKHNKFGAPRKKLQTGLP